MSAVVRSEREAMLASLRDRGPDSPTLCEGWTTADLAAHLAARERRPDSLPGLVLPLLAEHTERVRLDYRRRSFDTVLGLLAAPPWWSPTAAIDAFDLAEWFVHHEDVRRAVDGWRPRPLPRAVGEALWGRIPMARALLRRARLAVTLAAPGYGRRSVGSGAVTATITGEPGELLLFCFGRQAHARVEVTGPDASRLLSARLGL